MSRKQRLADMNALLGGFVEGVDLTRQHIAIYRQMGVKPDDGTDRGQMLAKQLAWLESLGLAA